ncbi:MAG: hypothetical protein GW762_01090 [Candidatus Pacebacteria bacterium]|nr:hypothetical protein [Candidatus Paceibacterota bacterium]PIR63915.1 MAG: hypothetical protein COU64_01985 [Candidatus Pacebacteria bacterium CG10_big_fil_rev_8_21_14_0_10_40_26]PIZ78480.1 MAG: hypothetical protein COY01_04495 [Candidatus Pacebacteria bacterium CG_4_10_14_0_2_um_filter_40_20]PJA69330.1 MAG: hypothetical protein CO156_00380 [Candidatus Pacebacteria bacterium CG_4_9_14_3_um_filter_40_12]PJC41348.1 MAG: hypothetical protein CO041_04370 [Candidatus Pacebacteria bacterium CG_4_9_
MQENHPQTQDNNEIKTVQSAMNLTSTNPILYILTGFGVAVVAFGLGYMVRGYSVDEYMVAQEIIAPEPMTQEETVSPLVMMEEPAEANLPSTILESEDFVYTDEQLGFSLTLPPKYSVIGADIMGNDDDKSVSIMFYLPVNNLAGESSREDLFIITRFAPGTDISQHGPGGQKITTTKDGNDYYFYANRAIGLHPEQPEYEVYFSLGGDQAFDLVKDGFKLL